MRCWLSALWARVAVIAIGRKVPETLTEQKRRRWSGPERYRQTYSGQPWKLRMARRIARRKVS